MTLSDAPACTGTEPPCCCQPAPIPPAFLSTRAYIASLGPGGYPTRCAHCSSPWIETVSAESCRCLDCGRRFCWRD